MLGAAFFHMIPEAVRVGSAGTVRWTAVGLLALFFLERFFSFHHHETEGPAGEGLSTEVHLAHADTHDQRQEDTSGPSPSGVLPWGPAAFGLAVHSLAGGIALASAVAADLGVGHGLLGAGLGVFIATLVHKPADALTITALMLRAGAGRRSTHLVNLGFALMIPAGVVLFWIGIQAPAWFNPGSWTSGALAFSAGTFLCIALSDLLPELQFHSHDRFKLSAALLAGFVLLAGTALLEPDAEGHHESPPVHAALHPPKIRADRIVPIDEPGPTSPMTRITNGDAVALFRKPSRSRRRLTNLPRIRTIGILPPIRTLRSEP
jgi:zinc and cadmium transporter